MEADLTRPPTLHRAHSLRARLPLVALAVSTLAGTGCSSDKAARADAGAARTDARGEPEGGAAAARVFTGTVSSTDAEVSAVVTAHHARFYFCGGNSTYATLSRWVTATVSGGIVTADETAGAGWTIHASLDGDRLGGFLSAGDAGTFEAGVVDHETIAGLYEAMAPCGKVGLIVTQASAGDTPAGQGACIGTGSADIHQVNPVLPLTRSSDGTIRVIVDGTDTEVQVSAAAAPAN